MGNRKGRFEAAFKALRPRSGCWDDFIHIEPSSSRRRAHDDIGYRDADTREVLVINISVPRPRLAQGATAHAASARSRAA